MWATAIFLNIHYNYTNYTNALDITCSNPNCTLLSLLSYMLRPLTTYYKIFMSRAHCKQI